MARKKTKTNPDADGYPIVVEAFNDMRWLTREASYSHFQTPGVGNMSVRVRRYRMTVELIDEPIEVIQERIKKLWRETDNHHEWDTIRHVAERYGLTLDIEERGVDRKKRSK